VDQRVAIIPTANKAEVTNNILPDVGVGSTITTTSSTPVVKTTVETTVGVAKITRGVYTIATHPAVYSVELSSPSNIIEPLAPRSELVAPNTSATVPLTRLTSTSVLTNPPTGNSVVGTARHIMVVL
jgi:hypothetical protein